MSSVLAAASWGLLLGVVGVLADKPMTFTIYSDPIELRYGEVYNTAQDKGGYKAHPLPKEVVDRYASGEKRMAIQNFTIDMVRIAADGTESSVKLSDHYLHHYILSFGTGKGLEELIEQARQDPHLQMMLTGCHGMTGKGVMMFRNSLAQAGRDPDIVNFGSAAGAEYRHNPQGFFHPYALVLRKPEAFLPTYHVINTQKDNRTVSKLLECPCTPQRKIDPKNGTIDGKTPYPPFDCSPEFAATGNRACSLSTYVGGWRCCEHHMFLIDTDKECRDPECSDEPRDRVYMKLQFEYEDETPETRNIEPAACCDTTSSKQGLGNIEHDVPACENKGENDECIYVSESVQPVGYYDDKPPSEEKGSDLVDLVYAAPHLHWSGISTELIDAVTNKTLCKVERTKDNSRGMIYGTGDEVGNERDYLVGLFPCQWGPENAPRFRRDHPLRSRSIYSATEYHMGVMSLWLSSVSAVPKRNSSGSAAKDGFVV